jgi:hypothetical protein
MDRLQGVGNTIGEHLRFQLLRHGHDRVVVEVAGRGDDDVVGGVAAAVVGGDVRHRDVGNDVGPAEDAAAERRVTEDRVGEVVVDAVRRLVLVHGDLLEYDVALGVDVGEGRFEQHLAEQVEDLVGVLVEETRVQVRRLLAGGGVERRPEPVEALGDLDRRIVRRALERNARE